MSDQTTRKKGRRLPSWWVWILMLIPLGLAVWLRTGDRLGDQGSTNVFSALLMILGLLIFLIWFLVSGGYRLRTRLGTLLGIAAAIALLIYLFPIRGFSGSMSPQFEFRFARSGIELADASGRAVDLSTTAGIDFPGFLGATRDQTVAGVTLDGDWENNPPELLWHQPIGAGWSGFAVVNGVAITQEEREATQMVSAYDVETGELLWTHTWPGSFNHPMGGRGPRATPSIDEGRVYALGPNSRFVCLDGADGSLIWEVDLRDEFDFSESTDRATMGYGRSNSPCIHGDLVILPVGGDPSNLVNLAAFDKHSGDVVWTGSRHQASYSSPRVATVAGVEQVLIINEDTASGHDVTDGRLLWSHEWPGRSSMDATSSQVVPLDGSSVMLSKGYGIGVARLDLEAREDGTCEVTERWRHARSLRTKFTNVVIHEGHAYGLNDGILECVELEDGTRKWKAGRYGHGQILGVGDHLIVLSEDGEVLLVELSPERKNNVLGSVQAVDGVTWNTFALWGEVLVVRSGKEAAAFRLALTK